MENNKANNLENSWLNIQSIMYFIVLVVIAVIFLIYQIFNESPDLLPWPKIEEAKIDTLDNNKMTFFSKSDDEYWIAPDIKSINNSALAPQIEYGRDLIQNTAKYLGPKGSISHQTNGMNCQNCHLDAGTRIFGNNYGSVASTFPKFRARSGTVEDIYKRVNDCIERSLNGQALDTLSEEMQAIKAYMLFLGSNVAKGTVVKGSGLKQLKYLDRAADPTIGKAIYQTKCASCHMANGQGQLASDGIVYTYPPLWGPHSYNDGAGLYRLSNFAKYVKVNMPLGATYEAPQLSDEEAWDLAAFVNSQPRPHKNTPNDWPDHSKKPIDHPFGPYSDNFTEKEHKFGPFQPIADAHKSK